MVARARFARRNLCASHALVSTWRWRTHVCPRAELQCPVTLAVTGFEGGPSIDAILELVDGLATRYHDARCFCSSRTNARKLSEESMFLKAPKGSFQFSTALRTVFLLVHLVSFGLGQSTDRDASELLLSKTLSTGMVVDDQGVPIPGATLRPLMFLAWEGVSSPDMAAVTTDEQGRWEWDHAARPDIQSVAVRARGYLSETIVFTLPGRFETVLRKDTRVVPLTGSVTNPDGAPVEGATVLLASGVDYGNSPKELSAVTDAAGRFALQGRLAQLEDLRAAGPDGSVGWYSAPADTDKSRVGEPTIIVHSPNRKLDFRVTDEEGNPLEGASNRLTSWQRSQILTWSSNTDVDGAVSWARAPAGRLVFVVTREGYCPHWQVVEESEFAESPITIVLKKPHSMKARVVDAQTGEPIPEFYFTIRLKPAPMAEQGIEIQLPEEQWEPNGQSESDGRAKVARGVDGTLEAVVRFEIQSMIVRVAAIGYLPQTSTVLAADLRDDPITIPLVRDHGDLAGADARVVTVVNPDGSPARGAYAMELSNVGDVRLRMTSKDILFGKLFDSTQVIRSCDRDGRVALSEVAPRTTAIVFWNELGIALVDGEAIQNETPIQLQRYAKVRLRLSPSMHSPLRVYELSRGVLENAKHANAITISLTEPDGRTADIRCERVPPGRVRLSDPRPTYHHPGAKKTVLFEFDAEAGEEYDINLEGTNRIVGRVEDLDKDLLMQPLVLRATMVDADSCWYAHETVVQQDGSFAFEGILPGEYEIEAVETPRVLAFRARVAKAPEDRPYVVSGYLSGSTSVAGENQTIDVGDLSVVRSVEPRR